MAIANPGRAAAARTLIAVDEGAHTEDALDRFAPEAKNDRALAWFLAFGVLRRRAHVDAALRPHLRRPLDAMDADIRAVLRVGAFEKLYGRAAPHVVVHQAVEVIHAIGGGRASGLVNAVMRRVEPATGLSRAESLDHPDWLVERWSSRYGSEATDRWCSRNGEPPPLVLVARDARVAAQLQSLGLEVSDVTLHGRVLPDVVRVDGHEGRVPALPGFTEGRFWVQDAASVLVADQIDATAGLEVLDACAAPGGKSFRLLSRGARVLAVDRDPARLAKVNESAKRLGMELPTVVHDWTIGPLPRRREWPVVLVDAPCTALGTIRRHPEVRWRRQPGDIATAAARQRKILANTAVHVARGGALVYAVCSPEPEEGPELVRGFVRSNPEFRVDAELSTAPPEADEDAFYGARLVRA